MANPRHAYLKRLPAVHYCGTAWVHWIATIDQRRTGWLDDRFHWQYREILIHTTFRHRLVCPIYCCMPDHIHLLWAGLGPESDQRQALRYLRLHLNRVLRRAGFALQLQAYDHVLREEERQLEALVQIVDYIARNPERKRLVPLDGFARYPFTACVIPGYPELELFRANFWEAFWRVYSHLCG